MRGGGSPQERREQATFLAAHARRSLPAHGGGDIREAELGGERRCAAALGGASAKLGRRRRGAMPMRRQRRGSASSGRPSLCGKRGGAFPAAASAREGGEGRAQSRPPWARSGSPRA
jgi:hypothetical protein